MKNPTQKSDALLALQKGDSQAIRRVYEEAFPACANLITQNSGSEEDAKDIFQEALLVLIKKLKQADFKLTASIKTFMYAVVRNLWLKQLRKRGKKGLVLVIDEPDNGFQIPEDEDFLTEKKIQESRHLKIEAAMNNIPEECKKIILNFYFHKLSLKEIAKELEYSDNFIKVKKKRCMDQLKNIVLNTKNKSSS